MRTEQTSTCGRGLLAALIATLTLALASCLPAPVSCGDGVCTSDKVCDPIHEHCVFPAQLESCLGQGDGVACVVPGDVAGVCHREVCLRRGCGDGMVDADEEKCDGDDLGGKADCRDLAQGFHEAGQLRCGDGCQFDTSMCGSRCGDGVIQDASETCDGDALGGETCVTQGFYGGTLTCNGNCQLDAARCDGRCGDRVKTAGEACDGTDFGGQTCVDRRFYSGELRCTNDCTVDTSRCSGQLGDGVKNGAELCDGADLGGLRCETYGWYGGRLGCNPDGISVDTSQCTGYCGDGVVDGNELCDGLGRGGETCVSLGARGGATGCNAYCQLTTDTCWWGRWRPVVAPMPRYLEGIWGSGPDDVWVYGWQDSGGVMMHFDGRRWEARDVGTTAQPAVAFSLWGSGRDSVWLATSDEIRHFDGSAWSRVDPLPPGHLVRAWARSPDDLWLLMRDSATQSSIQHFDGTRWDAHAVAGELTGIWGSGPDDVWAVGERGSAGVRLHFDGASWSPPEVGPERYRDVWGSGPRDVWVAGADARSKGVLRHFDGHDWVASEPGNRVRQGWSTAPTDAWALGEGSDSLLHYDGTAWTLAGADAAGFGVRVWSSGAGDAWLLTDDGIRRFDGAGWRPSRPANPDADELVGVVVTGRAEVWAATGYADVRHFDGQRWTSIVFDDDGFEARAIWASGPDDVWIVGEGATRHLVAGSWIREDFPDRLLTIWGSGPDDVWASSVTRMYHRDGAGWQPVDGSVVGPVKAIAGRGPDDVWAVSLDGALVWHRDGATWTSLDPGSDARIYDVWSGGPGDVWAFCEHGVILHFDGRRWTEVPSGTVDDVIAAWGAGPADIWALTFFSRLLHYDGARWALFDPASPGSLLDLAGSSGDDVWAVGWSDTAIRLSEAVPHARGGDCGAPIPLYCNATQFGGAAASAPRPRYACGSGDDVGAAVSYRLENPVSGDVTVRLEPAAADLDLVVLGGDARGACTLDRCLGASQRDGVVEEEVALVGRQGDALYVEVDSPTGAASSYTIAVTCAKR